ncbi:MAG: class I SAM-dependent methyltransferase [Pseudomonadota bacterium]
MTAQALTLTDMTPTETNADKSRRFWDRMARKYAKGKIADQAGYERSLERTRDFLATDQDVLEIGCGTGTTALHHAPFVRHITGTDISPEMVEIAREKIAETGPLNADFIASTAENLPFPTASFDVAMGHNLYHLVDDVDAALAEAHRVTKPGGIFITKTPCLGEMNAFLRNVVMPVMKRFYGVAALQMFTTRDLKAALTRAGFEIMAVEFHGTKGKDTRPFIVARRG